MRQTCGSSDDRLLINEQTALHKSKSAYENKFATRFRICTSGFSLKPLFAQIAQLVEQWTENPRVAGSIPALGTEKAVKSRLSCFYLKVWVTSSVGRALDF